MHTRRWIGALVTGVMPAGMVLNSCNTLTGSALALSGTYAPAGEEIQARRPRLTFFFWIPLQKSYFGLESAGMLNGWGFSPHERGYGNLKGLSAPL